MSNVRSFFLVGLVSLALASGCDWLTGGHDAQQPPVTELEITWEDDAAPVETEITAFPLIAARDAPFDFPVNRNSHRQLDDPYFILGNEMPPWRLAEWSGSEPLTLESQRGRVVVVHFWSDDSQRSMLALQQLAEEFRSAKAVFIGVYFSAGRLVETDWEHVLAKARDWGIEFRLAYDRQWLTLTRWWLARYDNLPLTPTFVLGPEGKVVHLHPGPALYPSDDPAERLANEDFQALRAAIRRALVSDIAQANTESPVEPQP